MIKDVTNSIKATLYQRVNSPLYGTFIFAWMLYNWEKTLKILFGSDDFDARLADFKISFKNSDTGGSDYWAFLVPVLTTTFILFFQPIIQRMIFVHYEKNKNIGLNERDKLEGDRRFTVEESMALKDDLSKLHERNKNSLQAKEDDNQELSRKYKIQVEINKDCEVEKNELTNELSDLKTKINDLYFKKTELNDNNINLKKEHENDIIMLNAKIKDNKKSYDLVINKKANEINELNEINEKLKDEKDKFKMIIESTDWFLNDSFKREFPQLFILRGDGNFSIQSNLYDKLLHESDDPVWEKSCFTLMIYGFGRSYSYDYADGYFTNIIRPNLKDFDEDDFTLLIETMNSNGQIKDRARGEKDMEVVRNKREELREFS